MANLEPMPISSLPEGDIQDGDKAIIYRESTGKAYQTTGLAELNADLTDLDVMGATGTAVPQNADLNDYLTPGKYYVQNSSIAGTLTNAPFTTAGFSLYVFKQVVAANTVFQLAVRTSTSTANILAVRICSAGTWGSWYLLSASALSTTSLHDIPEDGDV